MTQLKIEVSKKDCILILQIQFPLDTLRKLTLLLEEKKILVESMLLINEQTITLLVVHLLIEKDLITSRIELIRSMPGILRLDEGDEPLDKKSIIRLLAPFLKKA